MHYPYRMDCQICLRGLERFEPLYRMQFAPQINNGWRTSVCSRCLSAFVESLKRPGLRDGFRSPKPCEVCARPVYNLKRWTITRVICSPRCRGIIDIQSGSLLRHLHQRSRSASRRGNRQGLSSILLHERSWLNCHHRGPSLFVSLNGNLAPQRILRMQL
jgi:hypothetical protein